MLHLLPPSALEAYIEAKSLTIARKLEATEDEISNINKATKLLTKKNIDVQRHLGRLYNSLMMHQETNIETIQTLELFCNLICKVNEFKIEDETLMAQMLALSGALGLSQVPPKEKSIKFREPIREDLTLKEAYFFIDTFEKLGYMLKSHFTRQIVYRMVDVNIQSWIIHYSKKKTSLRTHLENMHVNIVHYMAKVTQRLDYVTKAVHIPKLV